MPQGTDFGTMHQGLVTTGPTTLKDRRISRKQNELANSPYMQGLSAEFKMSSKEAASIGVFEEP